jgi:hypothetical protein
MRPAAGTAGERLVVRERAPADGAAERHVVHRARARGGNAIRRSGRERAQEDVHDPLRGLDVAARTAAGKVALTIEPSGATIVERLREPSFGGTLAAASAANT